MYLTTIKCLRVRNLAEESDVSQDQVGPTHNTAKLSYLYKYNTLTFRNLTSYIYDGRKITL